MVSLQQTNRNVTQISWYPYNNQQERNTDIMVSLQQQECNTDIMVSLQQTTGM